MSKLRVTQKLHVISFHCSKCGACCNSAPQLSLPELLYHQHRFIGCLTLRRVEHLRPGMRWAASAVATAADVAEFEEFVPTFLQSAPGRHAPELIWLASQAFDEPTRSRCPALGQDNLCSLQLDNKPEGCRSVPLEPLLPDSLQRSALAQRAVEATYSGADCIALGPRKRTPLLVAGRKVADGAGRHALAQRRTALALDRRFWGDAVFEILRPELFDQPERVTGLPSSGYLSLSLAPALAVIAAASDRARARVVEYLSAQIELLAEELGTEALPVRPSERTLTSFLRANVALRGKLQEEPPRQTELHAADVEAWLGIGPCSPEKQPSNREPVSP